MPKEKIEPMFTEREVLSAKNMLDRLQNDRKYESMKPFYIAGEIVMWDKMKDLAVEFAEWIEKDYMAIDPKNWKKLGDAVSVIYSAKQLFTKFLEERKGK